jgi:hypothetical protein
MTKGIKIETTAKGFTKKIILDVNKIETSNPKLAEMIDDFIDHILVEDSKNEPTISLEQMLLGMNKKHKQKKSA